jgi:hypothetical protein
VAVLTRPGGKHGEPAVSKEDSRCPECFGTNLKVVNIRDVQRPRRKGEPADAARPVVARKIEVQCRRCKWSGFVVKPVSAPYTESS